MNNTILHISDLHMVLDIYSNKSKYSSKFVKKLIYSFKSEQKKHNLKIKYLIISGDIANSSNIEEYSKASVFLNRIVDELKINKKNVLICPGNHDISWYELDKVITQKHTSLKVEEIHRYHLEKFKNFTEFYNHFFDNKKNFRPDTAIVDTIIDDEDQLVIIALNTCFRESNQTADHIGFVNPTTLEKEIKDLKLELKENWGKIIVMHHNPMSISSELHHFNNWNEVSEVLLDYSKSFICGHVHGADSKAEINSEDATAYFVAVGSLLKVADKNEKPIESTYNLYHSLKGKVAKTMFYQLIDFPDKPSWQYLDNKNALKEFSLRNEKSGLELESIGLIDTNETTWNNINPKSVIPNDSSKGDSDVSVNNFNLIDFIKANNLYKSGHFHWHDDFRSHGHIDINYLVSKKESLEYITSRFADIISENVKLNEKEVIVLAIGIECNIVGARLSVVFPDFHYSFIPEPEKNDFVDVERQIKAGKFDLIIILKDIIFEAKSSKKFISSIEINDNRLLIISLFYCGKKENESKIFDDYDNVQFHSICNEIEIPKCSYSDPDGLNRCPIFKNKLEPIIEMTK